MTTTAGWPRLLRDGARWFEAQRWDRAAQAFGEAATQAQQRREAAAARVATVGAIAAAIAAGDREGCATLLQQLQTSATTLPPVELALGELSVADAFARARLQNCLDHYQRALELFEQPGLAGWQQTVALAQLRDLQVEAFYALEGCAAQCALRVASVLWETGARQTVSAVAARGLANLRRHREGLLRPIDHLLHAQLHFLRGCGHDFRDEVEQAAEAYGAYLAAIHGYEVHPTAPQRRNAIGDFLRRRGEHEQAALIFQSVIDSYRQVWGTEDPLLIEALAGRARALAALGQGAAGRQLLDEAVAITRRHGADPEELPALRDAAAEFAGR